MSRQTQNMMMGGLACVVAAVAMIAATLVLTGGDDSATAVGDPAAPAVGEIGSVDEASGASGISSSAQPDVTLPAATRSTLDVALSESPASSSAVSSSTSTSTTARQTTTAAPTTTSTTAAPAISAAAGTEDPATSIVGSSSSTTSTTNPPTSTTAQTPTAGETTSVSQTSTTTGVSETTTTTTTSSTVVETVKPPVTRPTEGTVTRPTAPPNEDGSLNAIEWEIARLTNELRTNPNGALKRQGPVINCGGRIRVADNQYEPIGAVAVHETASLKVARPWSAQMSRSNFKHRPNAGVGALQDVGISIRSAGENIAYHNYSDKAMKHFSGWRESDGHFCNMMDPGYTHLGVGEVTKADGISYATQNFFSQR